MRPSSGEIWKHELCVGGWRSLSVAKDNELCVGGWRSLSFAKDNAS